MCLWVCWIKPKVLGLFLDILAQVQNTAVNRQTGQFIALGESTSQVSAFQGEKAVPGTPPYLSSGTSWQESGKVCFKEAEANWSLVGKYLWRRENAELFFGMILKGFYFT